jgi:hypothetical protein
MVVLISLFWTVMSPDGGGLQLENCLVIEEILNR